MFLRCPAISSISFKHFYSNNCQQKSEKFSRLNMTSVPYYKFLLSSQAITISTFFCKLISKLLSKSLPSYQIYNFIPIKTIEPPHFSLSIYKPLFILIITKQPLRIKFKIYFQNLNLLSHLNP